MGIDRRRFMLMTAALPAAATGGALAETEIVNGPFRTPEELRQSLQRAGVSAPGLTRLLELARPGMAMQSKLTGDDALPVGCSKVGGAPDLPAKMEWPMRAPAREAISEDGETNPAYPATIREEIRLNNLIAANPAPLSFLMQVDLAECAAAGALDPDIPREGRLYLFYDLVFRPWYGVDENGTSRFSLLYSQTPETALQRRTPPPLGEGLPGGPAAFSAIRHNLVSARLTPVFTWTAPDYASSVFERYSDDPNYSSWEEAIPAYLDASIRLGGWQMNIQQDHALAWAIDQLGVDWTGPKSAQVLRDVRRKADEWVMLLQFGDYDDGGTFDFDGLYHVWIRRDDLKARDFTKAVLEYQTT